MESTQTRTIGVLTSGGDAPGMNAALRAVVRAAIARNAKVYAIEEGYQGMVDGGNRIRPIGWKDVGGILHQGGTVIGTARCAAFRTREGRLSAAQHLLEHGIDRLVVIGGDGSLTGADLFRQEWPSLLEELTANGTISAELAARHPSLMVVGLVGSIDNDFIGTDMTIGADTALQRITTALDQIASTAASHQRTFIVEVMGRNCGYLALMGALAGGADWVFIPEFPPEAEDWESKMCEVLAAGRRNGRRDSIVVVAEGARDRQGNPITAERLRTILEERLGEDARVSILGHVQRGGAPSAFDRWMSTLIGYNAVDELLAATPQTEPQLIGMRYNRVVRTPLMECVKQTHAVADAIAAGEYERALEMRGGSFKEAYRTYTTLVRALPHPPVPGQRRLRLGIMTPGAPSPGMNTAVRAAVRLIVDRGHQVIAIRNGFEGLIHNDMEEFGWMSVNGWLPRGGSSLGTGRTVPTRRELYAIARTIENQALDGLLVIGGWSAYESVYKLYSARDSFPAFNIPMVCLPASIDNNLPGSELSIGTDTALNNIVEVVDKIKESASSTRRCFVVEVMGRDCGYLALMGGIATGAERSYLPEEGVSLEDLRNDLDNLVERFRTGGKMSLMMRNENVNALYTTAFMCALFEEEGHSLFDVRQAVLGHLQQGGSPTPFDRIQATRLADRTVSFLMEQCEKKNPKSFFIGLRGGHVEVNSFDEMPMMSDRVNRRPADQWWLELRDIERAMAQPPKAKTS